MKKQTAKRKMLLIFLLIFYLAVMFYFSSQDGETSGKTSGKAVELLQSVGIEVSDYFVRKAAHFTEFCGLGILMYCLTGNFIALPMCMIAAMADEYHQTFVSGRAGMWQDVVLDSAGALFGALIVWCICKLRPKRKAKQGSLRKK